MRLEPFTRITDIETAANIYWRAVKASKEAKDKKEGEGKRGRSDTSST
jgi:hypothetical protein